MKTSEQTPMRFTFLFSVITIALLLMLCTTISLRAETNAYWLSHSKSDFKVLANPATNRMLVATTGIHSQVKISDALGNTLQKYSTGTAQTSVDITQLPQGTYFITVQLGEKQFTQPFIRR